MWNNVLPVEEVMFGSMTRFLLYNILYSRVGAIIFVNKNTLTYDDVVELRAWTLTASLN